ncbi:Dyp-type peroxidase [Streptomyces sp. DT24]|uniref:Dyp-type peroxidase n=1 Tax=Streptomyces sp. DT24 TaxID=3416520 RepID=UPI003CEE0766
MKCSDASGNHPNPRREGRRRFILGAAGLAGAVAAGPESAARAADAPHRGVVPEAGAAVPFHGEHQAGVLTPQQQFAAFAAFDVRAGTRDELADLLRRLTGRARTLVAGVKPDEPDVAALTTEQDRLTITVGVGASLFDDRFGLGSVRPVGLTTMPAFRGDRLDPSACHGDLSVQVCARHPDAVLHVLRDLTREARGLLRPRWRTDGFLNPPRPDGAPRSFIGFKDGIVNPDTSSSREMRRLTWLGSAAGEPGWARGGCYQVIRLIRLRAEAWDRVETPEQERFLGRHKATGAPLGGRTESEVPDFRADPQGRTIPLDCHIRRANPRTPETADSLFLRRSYNYDRGLAPDGSLDVGLVFCCYQRDIGRQFATVQRRLEGEPFADFITTTGGGYFLTLPGVRDSSDWFGSALLGT